MYLNIGTEIEPQFVLIGEIVAVYDSDHKPLEETEFLVYSPYYEVRAVIVTPYGLLPSPKSPGELIQIIGRDRSPFTSN